MKWIKLFENYSKNSIQPDRFVYHVSAPENRESILNNGLKVNVGHNYKSHMRTDNILPAIFATDSDNQNYWFDRNYQNNEGVFDDDVWEIDTSKIDNQWFIDSNYNADYGDEHPQIVTYSNIPKEAIKLIYKGEGFKRWEDEY